MLSVLLQVYASAVGLFVAAIMSALMSDFNISLPFTLAGVVVVSYQISWNGSQVLFRK